jgi:MFS family permease
LPGVSAFNPGVRSGRSWRDLAVRLAIALAFADASIVVIALPQIVDQLHTSISHVVWVIMAYNLALIVGVLAFLTVSGRVSSRRALLAGLAVFGLASLACGAANHLSVLVAFRCVQGAGGALVVCASLPLLAGAARPGESPIAGWAAAAAVGAAIGPAAGGVLTQVFDWRAIFIAQAPAAALAAAAVLATRVEPPAAAAASGSGETVTSDRTDLGPGAADVALLLLSAGLIGALFLVVVMLINVWLLAPIGAAAILSAIPLATILAERAVRGRSSFLLAATGATFVALGLVGVALISHRELGWVFLALAVCGAGLGLAFTTLTAAALGAAGSPTTRAGRTVIARDAGLVLGLLILTPVFVHDLNEAPKRATPRVTTALLTAPISGAQKGQLAGGLINAFRASSQASLPDLDRVFAPVRARATGSNATKVTALKNRLQLEIERAATRSFRRSLLYSAGFAALVLPVLAVAYWRRRQRSGREAPA